MHGIRNHRVFQLVAIDGKKARNARPVELLGIYNPHLGTGETTKTVEWSVDRIRYWLSVGALPTKSASKLLQMGGIFGPKPTPRMATRPKAISS